MTRFEIASVWRIPLSLLVGSSVLSVVLVAGDLDLRLPMTDGPRMVRQACVLALPVLLSALLRPPLPDLHASLLRSRLHHLVTRGVFWGVLTVVCAAAWVGRGISSGLVLFEMMSMLSVAAMALYCAPRFGVRVILVLTGLCCAWLLYGVPIGGMLGFGDLLSETHDADLGVPSAVAWTLTALALGASAVATGTSESPP